MEKQKKYAAVVWVSRSLSGKDLKCMSEQKEMEIEQETSIRSAALPKSFNTQTAHMLDEGKDN